jgi:5-methylthioribose kinase
MMAGMFELTPQNVLEYVRRRGWIGPGPARAQALGWGVSNTVFGIESGDVRFVLKQSRARLRTRDDWYSDLDRIYREQAVMELLYPLLPEPTVPRVLHSDRANYVLAMSHAPADARVWKESLLAGQTDPRIAARAGWALGTLHEATARRPEELEAFRDATVFIQLRVDPFYRRVQERRPEVAGAVGQIIDRMLSTREALCHGDFSPKNILVHGDRFTLVDYETAHFGDPTMDLGLFLSHLLLKALRNQPHRERFFDLTRSFWEAYQLSGTFWQTQHPAGGGPPALDIEARAAAHCGVCLLARIDGTSPVDYLPEADRRQAIRSLGRTILGDQPARWNEVLEMAEREFAPLGSAESEGVSNKGVSPPKIMGSGPFN